MEYDTIEFSIDGELAAVEGVHQQLKSAGHPCAELVAAVPEEVWTEVQKLTVSVKTDGDPIFWVEKVASEAAIRDAMTSLIKEIPTKPPGIFLWIYEKINHKE